MYLIGQADNIFDPLVIVGSWCIEIRSSTTNHILTESPAHCI